MASWKEILIDVIKLTDEVKRLNQKSELLSNCQWDALLSGVL